MAQRRSRSAARVVGLDADFVLADSVEGCRERERCCWWRYRARSRAGRDECATDECAARCGGPRRRALCGPRTGHDCQSEAARCRRTTPRRARLATSARSMRGRGWATAELGERPGHQPLGRSHISGGYSPGVDVAIGLVDVALCRRAHARCNPGTELGFLKRHGDEVLLPMGHGAVIVHEKTLKVRARILESEECDFGKADFDSTRWASETTSHRGAGRLPQTWRTPVVLRRYRTDASLPGGCACVSGCVVRSAVDVLPELVLTP